MRIGALAVGVWGLVACSPAAFPPQEQRVLDGAESVELFALHPYPDSVATDLPAGPSFHAHRILGQAAVTDAAERTRLIEATEQAAESSDGTAAKCFNPRHGLRVVHGGETLDFVICFECFQMHVVRGESERTVLIGRDPETVFDSALARHGLAKAKE